MLILSSHLHLSGLHNTISYTFLILPTLATRSDNKDTFP